MTVTVTPATGGFGSVTFTAAINGAGPGNPTGTVTFTTTPDVGGCATVTVTPVSTDDAEATCAITVNAGQQVTVNAAYSGDGSNDPNSNSVSYQADKKTSSVTVSPSTGPSGTVTFTAQVAGSVEPVTGTMDFSTGGPVVCDDVTVAGSPPVATCDITVNPGQLVTVTATYSGNATYSTSSGNVPYQADKVTPPVTVTPAGTGPDGAVTFTATIDGTGVTPTGTVTFTSTPSAGGCVSMPVSASGTDDGVATCSSGPGITIPLNQTITVTAAYTGDTAYDPNSGSATYTGLDTPTIDLGPTGIGPSGTVTFTAEVTGGDPTPTGLVDFVIVAGPPAAAATDGATGCTGVSLDSSSSPATATCDITVDPGEMVEVEAQYRGDTVYHSVTANTTYQAQFVASVTVTSPDADENGQGDPGTVQFIATVTGSGVGTVPRPMGTVAMTASEGDDSTCASLMLPSTGPATVTCTVSGIPSNAEVTVTATYTATVSNYGSGATGSMVYKTPTKTVTVAISAPPNSGAGLVPFTATVTSSDGSTPTGTVTISLQTTGTLGASPAIAPSSCDAQLTPGPGAGQASGTCSLNVPAGANVTVQAAYNGSASFFASSSQISFQGKRTPAVSLAVTPASPVSAGASVTMTATVGADSSGIAPTGTVRFDVNGTAITGCEAVPVSGGKAMCTTAALPQGSQVLMATYSGDAQYLSASAQAADYVVGTAAASATTLPNSGADVDGLLLGALLLLLAGGAAVAFGNTAPGRRETR